MTQHIPFYKPYRSEKASALVADALQDSNSLFSGKYSRLCEEFLYEKYGCKALVLTSSCTEALFFASLLLELQPGDEVIIPSYTFTSVANAFENRGIRVRLADSLEYHPNMDAAHAESLINSKTQAIIFMAYGGVDEGLEEVIKVAKKHRLFLIEDAAHAFDSVRNREYLGTKGDIAVFSFHESKAISCGQGGAIMVNNTAFSSSVKSIQGHGTDKWLMDEGKIQAYNWVSHGAEFNLPELNSAVLYSQFLELTVMQEKRKRLWDHYYKHLQELSGYLGLPIRQAQSNYYIFYIITHTSTQRKELMQHLKELGVHTAFHYTGLHRSKFYQSHYEPVQLPNCDRFSDCLLRLPLYPDLEEEQVIEICTKIKAFYEAAMV